MSKIVLGSIADDLTGATDLANNLTRAGMRVMLTVGVPMHDDSIETDAVVAAIKSRTIPAPEAVGLSLQACRWMKKQGVRQVYFKICSTFDSNEQGNIGPVIDALMEDLSCDFSVVVPAFPDNDRTVFKGHLFVGDVLLSDSSMRDHPLTPMMDSNLVRFLQRQVEHTRGRKVGLIDYRTVEDSAVAVERRIEALRAEGISIAIADTIANHNLRTLAAALCQAPLVTASSGLASSLPAEWGFRPSLNSPELPRACGRRAIISGSCSSATRQQVSNFIEKGGASRSLDPVLLASDCEAQIEEALSWAESLWKRDPDIPLLMYSTAEPAAVHVVQGSLGIRRTKEIVEHTLSSLARALVARGVGQLVVTGGETAGECIRALEVQRMRIGPQIDPGVPWCYASSIGKNLHIALKSGNFGSQDFFTRAFALLE
jgi:uncharacterized protein YgbK (DUF1537 family)